MGASTYQRRNSRRAPSPYRSGRPARQPRRSSAGRSRFDSPRHYSSAMFDGTAARAFEPAFDPAYESEERSNISVLRGRGAHAREQGLPQAVITLAVAAAAILVVIALLGFVRVTLSSATIETAKETRALSSQISIARAEGSTLEVAHSTLSNPIRIREMASALGMAAPSNVTYINFGRDIVATDEAGNLSLSGTMDALAAKG